MIKPGPKINSFVVEDTPKSQQVSNISKQNGKKKVYNGALVLWKPGDQPSIDKVQVTVIYFFDEETSLDVGIVLKPF
jgi:hypothetical protein